MTSSVQVTRYFPPAAQPQARPRQRQLGVVVYQPPARPRQQQLGVVVPQPPARPRQQQLGVVVHQPPSHQHVLDSNNNLVWLSTSRPATSTS